MPSQALDIDNLPTVKEEQWKYTNLKSALPKILEAQEPHEIVIDGASREEIIITGEHKQQLNPRLKIIVPDNTECTVVERHNGQGAYWTNMATEITVGANSKLHHIRINQDSEDGVQTNMAHVTLERDAVYDGFSMNVGGKLTRHDIHAVINGPNAECSLNGLNLLGGAQHGDTTILIEHAAPHCRSNQFYRSILDGRSRCVFQGKVHVHQIAQKTDGYQLSNALILSEAAEMDTKPELEIYADDVKCSHGATTGTLDGEPLFYLRTRGLSEAQAKMLLMQAFLGEVTDKITDETLREEMEELTEEWLQKTL